MKRLFAILALVGLVLGTPLAGLAGPDDNQQQSDEAGWAIPPAPQGDGGSDQQDSQGDPHDLGGGFRGSGNPINQNDDVLEDWLQTLVEVYFLLLI